VFVASAASTSVLLAVAVAVSLNDGFPNRHDATLSAEELAGDPEWKSLIECQRMPIGSGLCVLGKEGVVPSFILWGDSHARSLASGMSIVARQHGIAGIIASKDACPPLLGIDRRGRHDCREFNDQVLQFLSRSPSVSTVILHGRWALSAQGTRYKRESGESVALSDGSRTSESAGRDNVELFELGLRRTVESLQDMRKTVIVVAGIPEVGRDVPAALHAASVTRRDPNLLIAPSVDEFLLRNGQVFKVMSSIQQSTGIRIITPSELLCSSGRCKVASEAGVALYRDDHHLSTHGSRYVAQTLHEIFN
jgi:hypothetical protein